MSAIFVLEKEVPNIDHLSFPSRINHIKLNKTLASMLCYGVVVARTVWNSDSFQMAWKWILSATLKLFNGITKNSKMMAIATNISPDIDFWKVLINKLTFWSAMVIRIVDYFDLKKYLNSIKHDGFKGHTSYKTMAFLYELLGPNRVISARPKKLWKHGIMQFPPSSPQV